MNFAEKLKKLMNDLNLSQTKLSELTGIGKSSISQYISGKNEPSRERKKEMAKALGLDENYFDDILTPYITKYDKTINLPVVVAAQLMHKSKEFVKQGLRDGVFPWGYAVKLTKWSYFISSVKFTEYTGIAVPFNITESEETANE